MTFGAVDSSACGADLYRLATEVIGPFLLVVWVAAALEGGRCGTAVALGLANTLLWCLYFYGPAILAQPLVWLSPAPENVASMSAALEVFFSGLDTAAALALDLSAVCAEPLRCLWAEAQRLWADWRRGGEALAASN